MPDFYLSFKLRVEVGDNQIQLVYTRLQSLTELKQGVTLFAAVPGAPPCCFPLNGDINFISRPSRKFLSDYSGMLRTLYFALDYSISRRSFK